MTSFIYELPWGKGRRSEPSDPLALLTNDWVINGFLSLNAGRPFTVTAGSLAPTAWGTRRQTDSIGSKGIW